MKSARWATSSIHTPRGLAEKGRHLDHLNVEIERAVTRMRDRGAILHRTNRSSIVCWTLSPDDVSVSGAAARIIIRRTDIAPVGDALFDDRVLSQTWRWVGD